MGISFAINVFPAIRALEFSFKFIPIEFSIKAEPVIDGLALAIYKPSFACFMVELLIVVSSSTVPSKNRRPVQPWLVA